MGGCAALATFVLGFVFTQYCMIRLKKKVMQTSVDNNALGIVLIGFRLTRVSIVNSLSNQIADYQKLMLC